MKGKEGNNNKEYSLYTREEIVSELGKHLDPILITCGTYSSTLCSFVFPYIKSIYSLPPNSLIKSFNPSKEDIYPVLSLKEYHIGSISNISTYSNDFLFSSGFDEKINLFNMSLNTFVEQISSFDGSITALGLFYSKLYLVSGTSNGVVCVFAPSIASKAKADNFSGIWKKKLSGGLISSISVHPSDRLFVVTDSKAKFLLVSLIDGTVKCSFALRKRANIVKWWDSQRFIIVYDDGMVCHRVDSEKNQLVDVFSVLSNDIDTRVTSIEILNDSQFICGYTKGDLRIWSHSSTSENNLELIHHIKDVHHGRIKDIKSLNDNSSVIKRQLIAVVSDEGGLSIWINYQDKYILELQNYKNWNLRFLSVGINVIPHIDKASLGKESNIMEDEKEIVNEEEGENEENIEEEEGELFGEEEENSLGEEDVKV